MKLSMMQKNLMELKEEGIRLDNEYKKLQIKKIKLEILDLQKKNYINENDEEN